MSLGSDFISGFSTTFGAGMQAKRHKQDEEFERARQQLLEDKILQDAQNTQVTRQALRQSEIERNNRFLAARRDDEEKAAALADDPREQLAKAKAVLDLERIASGPTDEEQLQKRIVRMQLEQQAAALETPKPPAAPTAKVRQPIGAKGAGGFAEYELPIDQVPSLAAASSAPAYKSPFAKRLADLDRVIASEQAAIESGDRRRGVLNMTSREDIVRNSEREKLKLLGLELQDKVRAGVLTQEEADAEADRLLAGAR